MNPLLDTAYPNHTDQPKRLIKYDAAPRQRASRSSTALHSSPRTATYVGTSHYSASLHQSACGLVSRFADGRSRGKTPECFKLGQEVARLDLRRFEQPPFKTEYFNSLFEVGPMPVVSIDLPPEVFSALRRSPDEFANEMRLAAAIHWYSRGVVSQEKAAAIAGLDRVDFLTALAREKVDVFSVDFESLRQELARG